MPRTFFNKNNVPGLNRDFRPRIEVKPFGQWAETIRMMGKLNPAIKQSSLKAQLKVCRVIKKKVKAHLRDQDLGWKALNPKYAQKKVYAHLDPRVLIAVGTYYWSIDVWQKGSQHIVFCGVRKGIYTRSINGKRSKLDVAQIAAIHEFATGKRMPRRPLWNPTIAEMGGSKGIQTMFLNSFAWWLQKNGVKFNRTLSINKININSFE